MDDKNEFPLPIDNLSGKDDTGGVASMWRAWLNPYDAQLHEARSRLMMRLW